MLSYWILCHRTNCSRFEWTFWMDDARKLSSRKQVSWFYAYSDRVYVCIDSTCHCTSANVAYNRKCVTISHLHKYNYKRNEHFSVGPSEGYKILFQIVHFAIKLAGWRCSGATTIEALIAGTCQRWRYWHGRCFRDDGTDFNTVKFISDARWLCRCCFRCMW